MKRIIGLIVFLLLYISDSQAIYCDPSSIEPVEIGTFSKDKQSEKDETSPNRFSNGDCIDYPPITVQGYYPGFSSNYFDFVVWSLGGTTIPADALVAIDGGATPLTDRYGCGNSTQSDRETRARRTFEQQWLYSARIVFDIGRSSPNYESAAQWMTAHGYNGATWTKEWPNNTTSTFTVQLTTNVDAELSETSCQ